MDREREIENKSKTQRYKKDKRTIRKRQGYMEKRKKEKERKIYLMDEERAKDA